MCKKFYRPCEVCGKDAHYGDWCRDCLKKIDPWGSLGLYLDNLKKTKEKYTILSNAVRSALTEVRKI